VNEGDPAGGILGRITAPAPEEEVLASPVDVLLVDGDAVFRARVAALLRRNAHTVVEVASAAEGLQAVRRGCAPRLLVAGVEGISREERADLAALRDEPACAGASLLALTRIGGDAPPALSPTATLFKPLDAQELVEAVRRLCGTLGA
jgi:CheY-like chemotaxis protein